MKDDLRGGISVPHPACPTTVFGVEAIVIRRYIVAQHGIPSHDFMNEVSRQMSDMQGFCEIQGRDC